MKNRSFFIISLIIIFIIIIKTIVNSNIKDENNKENIQLVNQCIDDRYCKYETNKVVIGNNKKEVENNFYDMKFEIKEEKITVYINKLWYKEFNENLYEEEYLEWFLGYIQSCFNYNFNSTEKEELEQKIISKYNSLKNLNFNIQENLVFGKLLIDFNYNGCELVVKFERRTNEKENTLFSYDNNYNGNIQVNICNF